MRVAVVWLVALAACSFPAKHRVDGGGGDDDTEADAATPFSCAGRPFGTKAPASIMVTGQALDFGLGTPIAGATINGVDDVDHTMIFTATTDASGSFSATVHTDGTAAIAHVELVSGAMFVPSSFYPPHPLDADVVTPIAVLTPQELAQVGNRAGTAFVQVILVDCLGMPLTGCTLTVTPAPDRLEYTKDGKLDPTATSTDPTGFVLATGIDPGNAQLGATCPAVGSLRATTLGLAADAMYFVEIEP